MVPAFLALTGTPYMNDRGDYRFRHTAQSFHKKPLFLIDIHHPRLRLMPGVSGSVAFLTPIEYSGTSAHPSLRHKIPFPQVTSSCKSRNMCLSVPQAVLDCPTCCFGVLTRFDDQHCNNHEGTRLCIRASHWRTLSYSRSCFRISYLRACHYLVG